MIIPVYNAEKHLERCIASVQAQTFADFEALFIDDCSTDSSREIVKAYQSSDNRIRLIELEKNGGSGIARNIGIENARGEYLSFMDADDAVSPDFLKLLYEKAKETGADIVKGLCVYSSAGESENEFEDNTREIKALYDRGTKLFAAFVKGHWSAIYRRGFIEAHSIRYGETRVSQDSVFLLRAGYFAKSFETAPEAKYRYFNIEGSAVHTFSYRRFHASMLAVGEIVDFINENDTFSDGLISFLSAFLMRQLPVHSYLCTRPELCDKAPEFLENLRGSLMRLKNLNALTTHNYAVRALIELVEDNNIAPTGTIIGLKNNTPWMLYAYEKLIDHINSERSDKPTALAYLCSALANTERCLKRNVESINDEKLGEFYKELHGIIMKSNDKSAFIAFGEQAAKTMLEYGVNLFLMKSSDPIEDTENKLAILKRMLDLIEANPECLNDHMNLAALLSDSLLRRLCEQPMRRSKKAQSLIVRLAEQIKRMNVLGKAPIALVDK